LSEELEVLKIVAERLDRLAIPYMVTGSMAVNYCAVPRMTRDIDVVVGLSVDDADRFCDLFQGDFYVDRESVRRSVSRSEMFNLIHGDFAIKVDFVVRKDSAYRREEFGRRRQVRVDSQPLWLVAPEDLILSKLDWARSRGPLSRGEPVTDTSPKVARRFRELLLRRSGEERLKMGCSMHATARALVLASVLEKDPLASPAAQRRALFLRFYGHEFGTEARERILAALAGVPWRPGRDVRARDST